jgi:hypothetical protein
MARAKTGSFYLTETVTLAAASPASTRVQGEIDLGAYVSVAQGIAIAVESVDFIHQSTSDFGQNYSSMLAANGCISAQVTSLNPGTALVRADDQSLIASSALNIDFANNIGTQEADIYPDNHGSASLSEAYMVVNDSIFLVAGNDNVAVGGNDVFVTARLKVRIVSLSKVDWVAIAIQSTASDN